MGVIENIERGLEKAVRGVFSAGSKNRLEPVDLASRMRAEMDNKSYVIAEGRTIAPNVFTIEFAEADFPRAQDWGQDLAEELCDVAIRHARSQGYTLRGAVRVTFTRTRDQDLHQGEFLVLSAQERSGRRTTGAPGAGNQRPGTQHPGTQRRDPGQNAGVRDDGVRQASSDQGHYRRPAAASGQGLQGQGPAAAAAPGEAGISPAAQQAAHAPAAAAAASAPALPTGSSRIAGAPASGQDQRSGAGPDAGYGAPRSRRGSERAAGAPSGPALGRPTEHRPGAGSHYKPVLDINGQRFSIQARSIVLGRSSEADITVEDTGVSRRHLEILNQDGVFLAVDLGSTNGSFVDGTRLQGRRELVDGSVITMGRTKITFRLLAPRSGTQWPQS